MHKTLAIIMLPVIFMLLSWLPAGADRMVEINISAGGDAIFGHTSYEIGNVVTLADRTYRTHFPISRLEFPLNIQMLTVRADITVAGRLNLRGDWGRELTNDPGKLTDSDWETSPAALSIYSKSMLNMNAAVWSGSLRYTLFSVTPDRYSSLFTSTDKWSVFAGLGYRRQKFSFSAANTCQEYPGSRYYEDFDFTAGISNPSPARSACPGDYFPGTTLTYSVEYGIPYLELGFLLKQGGKAAGELSVGFSPLVKAEDEDHHLLRQMHSTGDCDGNALLLSAFYRYFWTKRWFSSFHMNYIMIETEGKSRTFINDTWNHDIDQEINSRQTWIGIDIGRAF